MKKKYKILIGILIVIIVIISSLAYYLKPLEVVVEEVKIATLNDDFSDEGEITALKEWQVFSTVSGTVTAVNCIEGDQVKAGDAIIEIDSTELLSKKQQLLQLQIQLNQVIQEEKSIYGNGSVPVALAEAQRNYDTAKKAYDDANALYEAGGISENDYTAAENAFKTAESALGVAKAQSNVNSKEYYTNLKASINSQITALERSISEDNTVESDGNLYILAPFDGRIKSIEVKAGQPATSYMAVASIYEPGQYQVEVYPLAADAVQLKTGDQVVLQVLGSSDTYSGRIKNIATAAQDIVSSLGISESRLRVLVDPDSLPKGYGPGFTIDVLFQPVIAENILSIPTGALLPYGEAGYAVYVAESGKAVLKEVETGIKAGGRVEIKEGLNEGDMVITDSKTSGLKEGIRLKY